MQRFAADVVREQGNSSSFQSQLEIELRIVCHDSGFDLEAAFFFAVSENPASSLQGFETKTRRFLEIREGCEGSMRFKVSGACDQNQGNIGDFVSFEPAILELADTNGDVDGFLNEVQRLLGQNHLELNFGITSAELVDRSRQQSRAQVLGRGQSDASLDVVRVFSEMGGGGFETSQGALAFFIESLTHIRQLEVTSRPMNQLDPEVSLELGQNATHLGLRHSQNMSCPRQVPGLYDFCENSQVVEIQALQKASGPFRGLLQIQQQKYPILVTSTTQEKDRF